MGTPATIPTQANIGYLSTFAIGDDNSPIAFNDVAEVKSIKPNIATIPVVDATHLKSPNATQEKIPGIIAPGTVDISGNFIGDSSQLQFLALAKARKIFNFKITALVQSGTHTYTLTGRGFISKYENGPFEVSTLNAFAATLEIAGFVDEVVEAIAPPGGGGGAE
jgi:hypothetical protein